jgi:GH35 family endo-1,4-beta-xylanase
MYGYKHQITSRLRVTRKAVPFLKCTLESRILAFLFYFGYCLSASQLGVRANMTPVGYMAKTVIKKPEWLKADVVQDVYSVTNCLSKNFADYIKYWKHNGYWFFDSRDIIDNLAKENSLDLQGTTLFYYEVYELEFHDDDNVCHRGF